MRPAALFVSIALGLTSCGPNTPVQEPQQPSAPAATSLPDGAFSAADGAELDAALAREADGAPIFADLPNPPLTSCALAADTPLCRYEQLKFIREWRQAYGGEYQAQRNVGYCLSSQCNGVQQNQIQGCAWRAVIIESASPALGDGDVANFNTDCGRLDPTGRAAAEAQAARILETISRTKS